jgi:endonuclease III
MCIPTPRGTHLSQESSNGTSPDWVESVDLFERDGSPVAFQMQSSAVDILGVNPRTVNLFIGQLIGAVVEVNDTNVTRFMSALELLKQKQCTLFMNFADILSRSRTLEISYLYFVFLSIIWNLN